MNLWLTIIGMGVITFLIRYALIGLSGRITLSDRVHRALRYVPAAVLATFIFTDMLQPNGQLDLSLGNFRLIAGLITIAIALITRNTLATIVGGLIALWILATWL